MAGGANKSLRERGFRRVSPDFRERVGLAAFASQFGYDVVDDGTTIWLRRKERARGAVIKPAFVIGPTIRRADVRRPSTYEFLREYRESDHGREQGKLLRYTASSLRAALTRRLEGAESFRQWHAIAHFLALSHPMELRSMLEGSILPAFFERDPDGLVQVLLANPDVDGQFAVLRATYSLSHYPLDVVSASDRGFATLKAWDSQFPLDYLNALTSILQASTYPYMPMFQGGPFGLSFLFLLSRPEAVQLDVFPRSWMQWTRSGSEFGTEDLDGIAGLEDPTSELGRRLAHRRYLANTPLPMEGFHELLLWAVRRLSTLVNEISDAANFEQDESIDFVCGLEHNLSMLRVFRQAVHILGSEEPPSGKLRIFEMADLLEGLAKVFRGRQAGEGLFKQLFNPTLGRDACRVSLASLPGPVTPFVDRVVETVYDDLRRTVEKSIWIPGKVKDGKVEVRSRDLTRENPEDIGQFVGTLVRSLRNTHHGYFSRLDDTNRPSRYLAMSTGDLPDSLSSLALIWILCLLADVEQMTGWKSLGVGYE
jgi:hypothetical protein